MRFVSLVALLSAASVLPVLADSAPAPSVAPSAQRVRGKIEAYDPSTRVLNITRSDKRLLLVSLEPDVRVIYDARLKLTDIKAGDFIGSTTLKTADGKLHAQEVHVFPDSMRGAGEGQYPASDANPNRLMTNATVAEVTTIAANKGTITLTFRGASGAADGSCTGHAGSGTGCKGNAAILVAPGIPIIGLMIGDEALLVPGMAVSVSAMPSPDGTLQSSRITVEKDGVKPIL
jgi:hypothetical protein